MVISNRIELAALWLPWCVARGEPTVPLTHLPAEHPRAMQLRITDLDDPSTQQALAWQPHRGGTSWEHIERWAARFRAQVASGEPVAINDDAAVLDLGGLLILREGCHRACGLYVAGLKEFELVAAVSPPFGPWESYRTAALRER